MRYFSFIILLLLSFSCTSVSQEKGDTVKVVSDTIISNANDSLLPHRITLLFAGDLMQHQGQINAARTPAGYDYSDCFKFVKEEISRADIARRQSGSNPRRKTISWLSCFQCTGRISFRHP